MTKANETVGGTAIDARYLKNERDQLIESWRATIEDIPDWISKELQIIHRMLVAVRSTDEQDDLDSYLRQFHEVPSRSGRN